MFKNLFNKKPKKVDLVTIVLDNYKTIIELQLMDSDSRMFVHKFTGLAVAAVNDDRYMSGEWLFPFFKRLARRIIYSSDIMHTREDVYRCIVKPTLEEVKEASNEYSITEVLSSHIRKLNDRDLGKCAEVCEPTETITISDYTDSKPYEDGPKVEKFVNIDELINDIEESTK